MHIAIGQHERCQALWVVRGENLGNGTAAVVANEIDPRNFQRIHHLDKHTCLGRE
jgi:hypothetical protein